MSGPGAGRRLSEGTAGSALWDGVKLVFEAVRTPAATIASSLAGGLAVLFNWPLAVAPWIPWAMGGLMFVTVLVVVGVMEVLLSYRGGAQLLAAEVAPMATLGAGSPKDVISEAANGVLWVWYEGEFYADGKAIARAHCPKHRVPLLFRVASDAAPRKLQIDDTVERGNGALYCPWKVGHLLYFTNTTSVRSAKEQASALLTPQARTAVRQTPALGAS